MPTLYLIVNFRFKMNLDNFCLKELVLEEIKTQGLQMESLLREMHMEDGTEMEPLILT